MVSTVAEDFVVIKNILKTNGVENRVNDNQILGLLELAGNCEYRTQFVTVQLEYMLGCRLQDVTHHERQQQINKRQIEELDLTEDQPSKRVPAVVVHTSNPGTPPKVKALSKMNSVGVRIIEEIDLTSVPRQISTAEVRPSTSGASPRVKQPQNVVSIDLSEPSSHDIQNKTLSESLRHVFDTASLSRLEKASMYLKVLLDHFPNIKIPFAAFKATEMSLEDSGDAFMKKFLADFQSGTFNMVRAEHPWTTPRWENKEDEEIYKDTISCFIKEQSDFLILSIPDADPEYLEERVKQTQGNQILINDLLMELVEKKNYPSRSDYEKKRKEIEEMPKKLFTAEEFLETFDDPIKYFYDETRTVTEEYKYEALEQLKMDFRLSRDMTIKAVFKKHNFLFAPSHHALANTKDSNRLQSRRQIRYTVHKDVSLIQEIAFVQHEENIRLYLKTAKDKRDKDVAEARSNGTLLECSICCENELIASDFISCQAGHSLCTNCVRRHSEDQIGLMKNHVYCIQTDCNVEYPLNVLQIVLQKSIYKRLEKRRQAEEVLAAGLEGLESCPFCDYCQIPPENERLFNCQNPDCMKVSCRQCRELDHLPLRCEEVGMQLRLRNYVETKMTEALVRVCPKCSRKFVKSEGCNKMVCPCGATMCYLCRQLIADYDHFIKSNDPNHKSQCPLFSDDAKLHEEEVDKVASTARAELAAANPNLAIDFILSRK